MISIIECREKPTKAMLTLWRYAAESRKHRHIHFLYPTKDRYGRTLWDWGCVNDDGAVTWGPGASSKGVAKRSIAIDLRDVIRITTTLKAGMA